MSRPPSWGGRRYIPIKVSVRGRDLAATIVDLQEQMNKTIKLPQGYTYPWAGEFDAPRTEQQRLAVIIPIRLLAICLLLYLHSSTARLVNRLPLHFFCCTVFPHHLICSGM
ncbi:MAG TPA: efflux RND transporter permease subunit [Acidisarcina sp.]